MQIKVYASGSKANLYVLQSEKQAIMLEAGLSIKQLKAELDFNIPPTCLVSHSHLDHARSVKDLLKLGVTCYMHTETAGALGVSGHRVRCVNYGDQVDLGEWIALFFETQHDCPGSMGFLLYHKDTRKKVLFATDTYYLRNWFKGLTHVLIECNYCSDLLLQNIDNGAVHPVLANRLLQSHFSLGNVERFFVHNDCSKLEKVLLLHLSDANSDEGRMKKEVQKVVRCLVEVAKPGVIIEI
jgi:phosphoribosyl 1,2-cyclic phosphodiesterase